MKEYTNLSEVLTTVEVAQCLRVSQAPIWRWCNSGQLPAFRIGRSWRVRRGDLEQLMRQSLEDEIQGLLANNTDRGDD